MTEQHLHLSASLEPPVATAISSASAQALIGAGLRDVLAERIDQIDVKGFTLAHDLHHHPADLVAAATSYANTAHDQLHGHDYPRDEVDPNWPWGGEAWRPGTARDNLVKAAAILLAAIDRLDHAPRDSGEVTDHD